LGAAGRAAVKHKAAEAGIAIGCVACSACFGNRDDARAQIEEARAGIDLAADVGAPRLRVFGDVPLGADVQATINVAAESLMQVADYARERGVIVCVETHSGFSDPARMAALMKLVNHPAIGVNWDVLHPLRLAGASVDGAFEVLRPWIHHLHIHDGLNSPDKCVIKAIGTGDVDHRRVLELCRRMAYAGYLSLEWEGDEPWQIHLPREIATMRRYEAAL
jgi:sugar phosphate isomerase/epimerase